MPNRQHISTRLLPALPEGEYINKPEEIDRFIVQILPGGVLVFKGSRARIEEFLQACKEEGLVLTVDHVSLCG